MQGLIITAGLFGIAALEAPAKHPPAGTLVSRGDDGLFRVVHWSPTTGQFYRQVAPEDVCSDDGGCAHGTCARVQAAHRAGLEWDPALQAWRDEAGRVAFGPVQP